jgi:hypothetical protein
MSDADKPILPEWGIHLRNLIDRVVPLVKEHHSDIDAMKQKVTRLELAVAQQQATIQQQTQDIAVLRAMTQGVGPTSTGSGG